MKIIKVQHDIETGCPETTETNCPICFEDITQTSGLLRLGCTHTFHPKCISIWFQTTNQCPICRSTPGKFDSLERPVETDTSIPIRTFHGSLRIVSDTAIERPQNHTAIPTDSVQGSIQPTPISIPIPQPQSNQPYIQNVCKDALWIVISLFITIYTIMCYIHVIGLIPLGITLGYKSLEHPSNLLFVLLSCINLVYVLCLPGCFKTGRSQSTSS